MASQNSIDAYIELNDSGELGEKQRIVFEYIKRNPDSSYNDLSRDLGWHHNTATARIKELRDMGYIKLSGTKIDPQTKKTNNVYRIREIDEEPDDTSKNVCPTIPNEVFLFLKSKTDVNADDGELTVTKGGVRYVATRKGNNVSLRYGDFVNIRNILVVCEDFTQNKRIITGVNFTLIFRIN